MLLDLQQYTSYRPDYEKKADYLHLFHADSDL